MKFADPFFGGCIPFSLYGCEVFGGCILLLHSVSQLSFVGVTVPQTGPPILLADSHVQHCLRSAALPEVGEKPRVRRCAFIADLLYYEDHKLGGACFPHTACPFPLARAGTALELPQN